MDHAEAVRIQATEKYLFGELTGELREAFEEHYFQCSECAMQLKAGAALVDAGRAIAREEKLAPVGPVREAMPHSGWLAWLRPAIAIPALAGLLLIVAYQNVFVIPRLKGAATHSSAPQAARSFSLISQNSRGAGEKNIRVGPTEAYILFLDIPPEPASPQYRCEFRSASGATVFVVSVSADLAKNSVPITISGGTLPPGNYTIVVRGQLPGQSGAATGDVVARIPFALEFEP
jgi:hypothetical protein